MKKIKILFILIFTTACISAQSVEISMKLHEGETYSSRISSFALSNMEFGEEQLNVITYYSSDIKFKVTAVRDNQYDVDMCYEKLKVSTKRDTNLSEFRSDSEDKNDVYSSILRALTNTVIKIKLSNKGQVLEASNLDQIIKNTFDSLSDLYSTEQMKELFITSFGEKMLKDNFALNTVLLPDKSINIGDSWSVNREIGSGGIALKIKTEYTLKEITDKFYRITGESDIESAEKNTVVETMDVKASFDLRGKMNSELLIDKQSAWTANAMLSQELIGEATISETSSWIAGLTLPLNITNDMSLSTNLYSRTDEKQKAVQLIKNHALVESLKDIYTIFYTLNIKENESISEAEEHAIEFIIKEKLSNNLTERLSEEELDELTSNFNTTILSKISEFNYNIYGNDTFIQSIDKELGEVVLKKKKSENYYDLSKQSNEEKNAAFILEKWSTIASLKKLYLSHSEKYNYSNVSKDEEKLIGTVIRKITIQQMLSFFDSQDLDALKAFVETTAYRKYLNDGQLVMPTAEDFVSLKKQMEN